MQEIDRKRRVVRLLNFGIQKVLHYPLRWLYVISSKYNLKYKFSGLVLQIFPEVFHPGFFFSSEIFGLFIEKLSLSQKKVLELGCGSGLLSLIAAKQEGLVTAVDINIQAVQNTISNAGSNQIYIDCYQSDLFESIPLSQFDFILVNPPYYQGKAKTNLMRAFYCGEKFEYFEKLFSGLKEYIYSSSKVYMILSENANIDKISEIATDKGFSFALIESKRKFGETQLIFEITHLNF